MPPARSRLRRRAGSSHERDRLAAPAAKARTSARCAIPGTSPRSRRISRPERARRTDLVEVATTEGSDRQEVQRIGANGLLAEPLAEGDRLRPVAVPPSSRLEDLRDPLHVHRRQHDEVKAHRPSRGAIASSARRMASSCRPATQFAAASAVRPYADGDDVARRLGRADRFVRVAPVARSPSLDVRPDDRRDPQASARGRVVTWDALEERRQARRRSLREVALGQPELNRSRQIATPVAAASASSRQKFERRPDVGPLGPESREGIHFAVIVVARDGGEVERSMPRVDVAGSRSASAPGSRSAAELAQDLEHAEPIAPGSLHALDERFLDKFRRQSQGPTPVQCRIGADLLGGVDLETASKYGESRPQAAAPQVRGADSSSRSSPASFADAGDRSGLRCPGPASSLAKTSRAAGIDAEPVEPNRGELECERQTVEPAAQSRAPRARCSHQS